MAKTLTIAGDDFLPQYKTNSANIKETVQNKSNSMNLDIVVKSGQEKPLQGSEVVFKDGARFLFGGYISQVKPKETGIGQSVTYATEVSDYSYIFGFKMARRSYTNQTLKYIVEDLLDEYVDDTYGFDTTNVATGPTIASITFDHISIRKCFEKIQKLTGYIWFVNYEKEVYFQLPTADPAPEIFTDMTANAEEVSISYDTSQTRNSVIVIGSPDGEQDSNTKTETFTGDGETRSWELEDKPSQVVSIKINGGSAEQFSLDVNERDTDAFVYSFSGQSFRMTGIPTTLTGADEVEIIYYPRVPIIVKEIDPASIAFFAALDGGDGTMEYTIKDDSIASKDEARERALQELEDYAMPLVTGSLSTRTGLLQAGSILTAGQAITINMPSYGISDDAVFLIQEVNINMIEDGDTTEYFYKLRFGGKKVGVQEFLESLASEEGEVTDAELILTIESTSDLFVLDDDAPTNDLITPPFEYGPTGSPQGKWNMSEWS